MDRPFEKIVLLKVSKIPKMKFGGDSLSHFRIFPSSVPGFMDLLGARKKGFYSLVKVVSSRTNLLCTQVRPLNWILTVCFLLVQKLKCGNQTYHEL